MAAACAGTPTRTYTPEQPSAATMEISQGIEQFRRADAYLLQPGDLLEIKVFMEDDMERTQRVSGGGAITFPLAGTIKVAGLTVAQAEDRLAVHHTDPGADADVAVGVHPHQATCSDCSP